MSVRPAVLALALLLAAAVPAESACTAYGPAACLDDQAVSTAAPYGLTAGANAERPATNQCICILGTLPQPMRAIDTLAYDVTALDADDTVRFALFNRDGTQRLFECALNVTSTGDGKTCANTGAAVPAQAGDVWGCLSASVVTTQDWQVRTGGFISGQSGLHRTFRFTTTCTGGTIPTTITPVKTAVNSASPPGVYLTDD